MMNSLENKADMKITTLLMKYIAFVMLPILMLTSCVTVNRYDQLVAVPLEQVNAQFKQATSRGTKKLGLAFGGGGVRGFIHLGVIRALEEEGIKADMVAGTSAGSIAAALYATKKPYKEIEKIMLEMSEDDIADFVFSSKGLIQGHKILNWVKDKTGNASIESLPLPLGIAVTDLELAKALLIVKGNIGEAVQASSSIPAAFIPVKTNGHTYVDGGVLTLLPVRFARAMGADIIVAIDVYCGKNPPIEDGMLSTGYAAYKIQSCAVAKYEANEADIVIRPNFEPKDIGSFDSREASIDAGYQAAKSIIPKLKILLYKQY